MTPIRYRNGKASINLRRFRTAAALKLQGLPSSFKTFTLKIIFPAVAPRKLSIRVKYAKTAPIMISGKKPKSSSVPKDK